MKNRISAAIREALDTEGVELSWHETDAAADAVMAEISDELEKAWQYDELCK